MVSAKTLVASLLALGASAQTTQQTNSYVDAKTGITFQGYTDKSGFTAGFVLPEASTAGSTPSTDYVGQIVTPLTGGKGWGGISLNGAMVGPLLLTAWPNGQNVVSSFRRATAKANPPVVTGPYTVSPIAAGTFVNSTHLSFTYRCNGCLTGGNLTFAPESQSSNIGWAFSKASPAQPASPSSALNYHSGGYGQFTMLNAAARSVNYATYAAQAANATKPTSRVKRAIVEPMYGLL